MIPEKVFHQVLALGEGWHVPQVDYLDQESKVLIRVENTPALWAAAKCPHCNRPGVHGCDPAPERRWRHLNGCRLQSEIVCRRPRGRCGACEKIYTVRAPWEGRRRSLPPEFEAFALTLMRELPVRQAGEILGETDTQLWRALFAHVDAAWSELSWENVVWVGADEMNRKQGHNYLTVFVALQAKRVLLAVEGKDARVWERFADELFQHNGHPKASTQIAMDLSPAHARGGRENFARATVVYDKFHVVSQVAKAVEEVRRKEARVAATAREHLEKTGWLWRKNPESWTEQEGRRWEQLSDKPLVTGLAYAMRLELQTAYASGRAPVARTHFLDWGRWVRTEAQRMAHGRLEPMQQAAEMIERHWEGILGHWKAGLTTAFLEGLNSLFSATKRKARGYRSSEHQTAMLYFVAGKLQVPYYG